MVLCQEIIRNGGLKDFKACHTHPGDGLEPPLMPAVGRPIPQTTGSA